MKHSYHAPKGPNKVAQGNALGLGHFIIIFAPKGQTMGPFVVPFQGTINRFVSHAYGFAHVS
jgi:hypothetical protein